MGAKARAKEDAKKQARNRRFSSNKSVRDKQRKEDQEKKKAPPVAGVIGGRGKPSQTLAQVKATQAAKEKSDRGDIGKETQLQAKQRKTQEGRARHEAQADQAREFDARVKAVEKEFDTSRSRAVTFIKATDKSAADHAINLERFEAAKASGQRVIPPPPKKVIELPSDAPPVGIVAASKAAAKAAKAPKGLASLPKTVTDTAEADSKKTDSKEPAVQKTQTLRSTATDSRTLAAFDKSLDAIATTAESSAKGTQGQIEAQIFRDVETLQRSSGVNIAESDLRLYAKAQAKFIVDSRRQVTNAAAFQRKLDSIASTFARREPKFGVDVLSDVTQEINANATRLGLEVDRKDVLAFAKVIAENTVINQDIRAFDIQAAASARRRQQIFDNVTAGKLDPDLLEDIPFDARNNFVAISTKTINLQSLNEALEINRKASNKDGVSLFLSRAKTAHLIDELETGSGETVDFNFFQKALNLPRTSQDAKRAETQLIANVTRAVKDTGNQDEYVKFLAATRQYDDLRRELNSGKPLQEDTLETVLTYQQQQYAETVLDASKTGAFLAAGTASAPLRLVFAGLSSNTRIALTRLKLPSTSRQFKSEIGKINKPAVAAAKSNLIRFPRAATTTTPRGSLKKVVGGGSQTFGVAEPIPRPAPFIPTRIIPFPKIKPVAPSKPKRSPRRRTAPAAPVPAVSPFKVPPVKTPTPPKPKTPIKVKPGDRPATKPVTQTPVRPKPAQSPKPKPPKPREIKSPAPSTRSPSPKKPAPGEQPVKLPVQGGQPEPKPTPTPKPVAKPAPKPAPKPKPKPKPVPKPVTPTAPAPKPETPPAPKPETPPAPKPEPFTPTAPAPAPGPKPKTPPKPRPRLQPRPPLPVPSIASNGDVNLKLPRGQHVETIGFKQGFTFQYKNLVTSNRQVSKTPKFGLVPDIKGITPQDSLRIISTSKRTPRSQDIDMGAVTLQVKRLSARTVKLHFVAKVAPKSSLPKRRRARGRPKVVTEGGITLASNRGVKRPRG